MQDHVHVHRYWHSWMHFRVVQPCLADECRMAAVLNCLFTRNGDARWLLDHTITLPETQTLI